jgi:hypothetical protein
MQIFYRPEDFITWCPIKPDYGEPTYRWTCTTPATILPDTDLARAQDHLHRSLARSVFESWSGAEVEFRMSDGTVHPYRYTPVQFIDVVETP